MLAYFYGEWLAVRKGGEKGLPGGREGGFVGFRAVRVRCADRDETVDGGRRSCKAAKGCFLYKLSESEARTRSLLLSGVCCRVLLSGAPSPCCARCCLGDERPALPVGFLMSTPVDNFRAPNPRITDAVHIFYTPPVKCTPAHTLISSKLHSSSGKLFPFFTTPPLLPPPSTRRYLRITPPPPTSRGVARPELQETPRVLF